MVALSRCVGSLALLLAGSTSSRVARKNSNGAPMTKFIAGVPVLNYDTAYGGAGVLGELETEREEEWVVIVNQGTSAKVINEMCKSTAKGCNLVGNPSKGGVPFVEMRGTEKDLETLIHSSHGAVRFAEPDGEVQMIPEIESKDAVGVFAATWGLNRVAKDQASGSGAGSTIFVLDTGVRVSHNEFEGRAIPALDMTGDEPVECNGDMTCAGDVQGHGTHCAGTTAGKTLGVAPAAAVRSVKVLSDSGGGAWSWSYYALNWLAISSVRPAISSMSLGGQGTQQAMKDSVDAAVAAGVVVVVASGNSNSDACGFSPAFVPSAITVNSMTSEDYRSSFSNYGSCTDIYAPGSDVVSCSHTSDAGTRSLSGTSMACPHVSGGAALVLEANPTWTPQQVIDFLQNTATNGALMDTKPGDQNKILYVGDGGAPPSPPATPPPSCPDWCGGSYCWYSSCGPCC